MKKQKGNILRWILLLSWMAFIFFMSHQPGDISSEYSDFVVKLFTFLGLDFKNYFGEVATFLVRKGAHFTEYFILFLLLYRVLILYMNKKQAGVFSVALVFLYACSDEFHQYFIPGRGPAIRDVIIDTSGGIAAFVITRIFERKR